MRRVILPRNGGGGALREEGSDAFTHGGCEAVETHGLLSEIRVRGQDVSPTKQKGKRAGIVSGRNGGVNRVKRKEFLLLDGGVVIADRRRSPALFGRHFPSLLACPDAPSAW
jgi:hypothetical protein